MEPMYYIGLDVHKREISYCVKDSGGKVYAEGSLPTTRIDLDLWMKTPPQPWSAAMACQVSPLSRLGEGAQALDAPVDKFRDWQEITNSIFCSRPLAGLRQQMEVWFYLNEEPQLRSQHTRRRTRKNLHPRSSKARQESFCPLDKDLSWKSTQYKRAPLVE